MPSFAHVHCVLCVTLFDLTPNLDNSDMQEVPIFCSVELPKV